MEAGKISDDCGFRGRGSQDSNLRQGGEILPLEITLSEDMPCRPMIMVEYAAFKKIDHTV